MIALQAGRSGPVRNAVIALLLVAASAVLAQTSSVPTAHDTEFARVDLDQSGEPRALQMAVVTYTPEPAEAPRAGLEVDLIGAV
ncbi:MAG: hypothetical protein AAGA61_10785, partial [Pseudomonadota bacterium]